MKLLSGAGPSRIRFKPSRQDVGVVGIVAIAAYLGLMTFLNTSNPFVVTRGTSMEPAYREGDLLINRKVPAAQLGPGDVIVFDVSKEAQRALRMPPRAAHRIISLSAEDGELVYVTKGDNSDVDPFKVKASAVTGLVVKNLGPIGHPVLLLSNSKIMVYLGLPIVVFVGVVVASLKFSSGNTVSQRPATGRVPRESSSEYFALETERLATAIVEFGAHLETHTAIAKVVSSASERLEESVHVKKVTNADLNDAVLKQNQILTGLLVAVENLNEQKSIDAGLSAHDSSIKPTPKETSKVA